jgi:YHS domain-containing protein
MLKGADVVAYFTQGRYVQGSPQFRSQYQGVDFRFASAEHKALFDKAPATYLPQYGGYCANGIVYGIPWGGDADTWKMIERQAVHLWRPRAPKMAGSWTRKPTWLWLTNTGRKRSVAATV